MTRGRAAAFKDVPWHEYVFVVLTAVAFVYAILTRTPRDFVLFAAPIGVVVAATFAAVLWRKFAREGVEWTRPVRWVYAASVLVMGPLSGTVYLGVFAGFVDAVNALRTANLSPPIAAAVGCAIVFTAGGLLFLLRLRHRAIYGATEILAGLVLAGHRVYSESASPAPWDLGVYGALLTAGAYLVVRGLDNMHTALSSKTVNAKK